MMRAEKPPVVGSLGITLPFRRMLPLPLFGVLEVAVPSTILPASVVPLFHVPAAGRQSTQNAACAVAIGMRS